MADIDIAQQVTEFEWSGGTPPRFRMGAKVPFLTADGVPVHAWHPEGNQRAFIDEPCTLEAVTNRVVIPALNNVPSTTDSVDKPNDAEYWAFLYSRGADLSSQYQEFSVFSAGFYLDHSDTSTDWEAIRTFNLGSLPAAVPHNVVITGTMTALAYAGNGSALTGIGVGTSTGHSAAASVSIIADNDNSGAGNDAGGIIDLMIAATTHARLHNDGEFELITGFAQSGGAHDFDGTYVDLRPTASQSLTFTNQPALKAGVYIRPTPVNGLQFGAAFDIEQGSTTAVGGFNDKVAIYAQCNSTVGGTTDVSMLMAANFLAQNLATAPLKPMCSLELNINNMKSAPSYSTVMDALRILNGGGDTGFDARYGILIEGALGATLASRFKTAIHIPLEGFVQWGIQVGNTDNTYAGTYDIALGQLANDATQGCLLLQRVTDASPVGTYIRAISRTGGTDVFYVSTNGNVVSTGVVVGTAMVASGDPGGGASTTRLTNVHNTGVARSTGVGTVKFADGTARDNAGFAKIYIGTTAYYVPVFTAN